MPYRNEDHDRLQSQEYPEPDTDEDTTPCPRCRAMIYDDCERCPACGHYVTAEEPQGKPLWVVLGALACLAMAVSWVIWG